MSDMIYFVIDKLKILEIGLKVSTILCIFIKMKNGENKKINI